MVKLGFSNRIINYLIQTLSVQTVRGTLKMQILQVRTATNIAVVIWTPMILSAFKTSFEISSSYWNNTNNNRKWHTYVHTYVHTLLPTCISIMEYFKMTDGIGTHCKAYSLLFVTNYCCKNWGVLLSVGNKDPIRWYAWPWKVRFIFPSVIILLPTGSFGKPNKM